MTDEIALIRAQAPFLVNLVYALRKMALHRTGKDDFYDVTESLQELVLYLCKIDLDSLKEKETTTTTTTAAESASSTERKKSSIVLRSEAELQELNNLEKEVRKADESLREAVNKAKIFREEAFAELVEMQRLHNNELLEVRSRIHEDQQHVEITNCRQHTETGNCRPPSPWNFSLDVLLDTHYTDIVHPRFTESRPAVEAPLEAPLEALLEAPLEAPLDPIAEAVAAGPVIQTPLTITAAVADPPPVTVTNNFASPVVSPATSPAASPVAIKAIRRTTTKKRQSVIN